MSTDVDRPTTIRLKNDRRVIRDRQVIPREFLPVALLTNPILSPSARGKRGLTLWRALDFS